VLALVSSGGSSLASCTPHPVISSFSRDDSYGN
jgi:hypothetical protein